MILRETIVVHAALRQGVDQFTLLFTQVLAPNHGQQLSLVDLLTKANSAIDRRPAPVPRSRRESGHARARGDPGSSISVPDRSSAAGAIDDRTGSVCTANRLETSAGSVSESFGRSQLRRVDGGCSAAGGRRDAGPPRPQGPAAGKPADDRNQQHDHNRRLQTTIVGCHRNVLTILWMMLLESALPGATAKRGRPTRKSDMGVCPRDIPRRLDQPSASVQ